MSLRVPLLDLQAQYRPLRDDILSAMARVCDSQRFIMGPEVADLEHELGRMLGVEHAIAVSSGTDALLLALMSLDIRAGDDVVTSAYSFFATAGSIVRLGARPVFVDIDAATLNIDAAKIAAAITPRTRAILPVHLFGLSADLDPVLAEASRAGIPVVEDAAQAIGATYKSRMVGGVGTVGCFSFFPSKNLGGFGDAGLLTTNDGKIGERARILRTHGMEPKYHHHVVGGNFRMDALQAAVLRVKAPHLAAWTAARRENASRYQRMFRESGLEAVVTLPSEPPERCHIFHQFVIRTPHRDALKRHLDDARIGNEIYYPLPLHLQPCFGQLGYKEGDFPIAERAAKESLALPIYGELTPDQQQMVVEAVALFFNDRSRAGSRDGNGVQASVEGP